MSASTEIFEKLRYVAYPFVRAEYERTGSRPDARNVDVFLASQAQRIASSTRDPDLTDFVIQDTVRSVSAYCQRMPLSGFSLANRRLFAALKGPAKSWARADRKARRAPVDRIRLHAFLTARATAFSSVAGQEVPEADRMSVVDNLATFFARMRTVAPEPVRPAATRMAREQLEVDVRSSVQLEAERAERDGRAPRRLSITALTELLAVETIRGPDGTPVPRDTGVTRSAVRGAVERLRGQPRRAARIDRLPPTARDLAGVLLAELPSKRLSVVTVDALAAKLWAPARTPAAKRQHVRRLRVAGEVLADSGVGLRLAVVGDHVVVDRGRVLPATPAALKALVADAVAVRRQVGRDRVHRLSPGLTPSRTGIWGTVEGEVAKAMARTVASQGSAEDVWLTLTAAGLTGAADDFDAVHELEGKAIGSDTLALAAAVETQRWGRLSGQAANGVSLIRDLVGRARDAGLDQAWGDLVRQGAMAERLRRASEASARERVRRIGAAFAKAPCPEAWEACVLISALAVRPGRRHKHPVPMPAAKPAPAPAAVAPPPRPQFVPTHVPMAVISGDLAEDVQAHWRVNRVQPSIQAMRAAYMGIDLEDARSLILDDLPQPATVEVVKDGLRRVLSWWAAPELAQVARMDKELGGALKRAVLDAGICLRDQGADAFSYAAGIVPTIAIYSRTAGNVRGLPRMLAERAERHRWNLAQAEATAA